MNIFRDLTITVSKVGGLYIVIAAPFFVDGNALLSAWAIGGALFGVKQFANTIKDVFKKS